MTGARPLESAGRAPRFRLSPIAQQARLALGTTWQRIGRRGRLGALLLLAVGLAALLAPVLSPYDPLQLDGRALLQGPSLRHPLGTDPYGRDTLTRILVERLWPRDVSK